MKKYFAIIFILILAYTTNAQFDGGGTFVGWQFNRSSISNAYYTFTGDSVNADNYTGFKDRFYFHIIDFRYGLYSENFMLEMDGSGILIACAYMYYLIAEKDMWTKNGRLRKIDDNLSEDYTGLANDWSFYTIEMAWGGNGILIGPRWDLGAVGVHQIRKEDGNIDVYPTTTWKHHAYNSLGLGIHSVNEQAVVSFRGNWLKAGKRNGYEIMPEVKVNIGELFYLSAYYKYRKFVEFENPEIGFLPKFRASTIGIRAGFWIADW